MAEGVLAMTPEAAVSVSVTGHLGPGAPAGLDGVIYVGWAEREESASKPVNSRCERVELSLSPPLDRDDVPRRVARQTEASQNVLRVIRDRLEEIARAASLD
jgi:nicotinamide-nucleotide amidase